mmetsp:Transcript_21334/g.52885  ORF Transcript_21334/g.52885 Transcript_21334/m.52885 type:complete len:329 (+) Transcript_21334:1014-2000(+)
MLTRSLSTRATFDCNVSNRYFRLDPCSLSLGKAVVWTTTTTTTTTARQVIEKWTKGRPLLCKEAMREYLPIIGNGAYMALASGFLMTDMLQLRLMLVGGYAGLVSFHALHPRPLQIPLRWSALFVFVNAGAAMLLFVDEWIGALLNEDELELYEQHFSDGLTPGQFYYLLKLSTTQEIEDGNVLTTEGRVSPYLYFIEKGQAKVYHHGSFASYVDEGGFVNDVAFQQRKESDSDNSDERSGVGAYGTVIANGDCKVWVWDSAELREYLEKRPDMDRNMKYTLSQHLVRSLLKQREVRRAASAEEQEVLEKTELRLRPEFKRVKTSTWP